jgi:hypothetical protein
MEAPRLVPQLFYDLIGRVIPGAVTILGITIALQIDLSVLLSSPFSQIPPLRESSLFLSTVFLAAAYLVGHMVAPLSDLLRPLLKLLAPSHFDILRKLVQGDDRGYTSRIVHFFQEQAEFTPNGIHPDKSRYEYLTYIWADWLHIEHPDTGARLAKIRAECRLHSELATAGVLMLLSHIGAFLLGQSPLSVPLLVAAAVIGILSAWSYARHFRIFQWGVINNYYAAVNARIEGTTPSRRLQELHELSQPAAHNPGPQADGSAAA